MIFVPTEFVSSRVLSSLTVIKHLPKKRLRKSFHISPLCLIKPSTNMAYSFIFVSMLESVNSRHLLGMILIFPEKYLALKSSTRLCIVKSMVKIEQWKIPEPIQRKIPKKATGFFRFLNLQYRLLTNCVRLTVIRSTY